MNQSRRNCRPLAGSYYIENLTDRIERKAVEYIKKIDKLGGAPKAIKKDIFKKKFKTLHTIIKWKLNQKKEL